MVNLERADYLMIVGMAIFVPSFCFQVIKLFKNGKATQGFSISSWLLNFVGRYLWIVYGMLMGSLTNAQGLKINSFSGTVILLGQGCVTLMTIPILYYTIRNYQSKGIYEKVKFNRWLFAAKLITYIFVIASMLIFTLGLYGLIPIPTSSQSALSVAIIATFFTGVAFLPQGIKVFKTKQTMSTSIYLAILFAIGNTLLILSLLIKIIDHNELLFANIGGIILPIISTSIMYYIAIIKLKNIIKLHEK